MKKKLTAAQEQAARRVKAQAALLDLNPCNSLAEKVMQVATKFDLEPWMVESDWFDYVENHEAEARANP